MKIIGKNITKGISVLVISSFLLTNTLYANPGNLRVPLNSNKVAEFLHNQASISPLSLLENIANISNVNDNIISKDDKDKFLKEGFLSENNLKKIGNISDSKITSIIEDLNYMGFIDVVPGGYKFKIKMTNSEIGALSEGTRDLLNGGNILKGVNLRAIITPEIQEARFDIGLAITKDIGAGKIDFVESRIKEGGKVLGNFKKEFGLLDEITEETQFNKINYYLKAKRSMPVIHKFGDALKSIALWQEMGHREIPFNWAGATGVEMDEFLYDKVMSGEVLVTVTTDGELYLKAEIVSSSKASNKTVTEKNTASEKIYGLLFRPKLDFKLGQPLDKNLIKPSRSAEDVLAFLKEARNRKIDLFIEGHLRGVDGPGSSLDLPEFQVKLTKLGAKTLAEHPSTPTLASDFKVKIRFELATDSNVIEYVAPDYGITADKPLRIEGNIMLDENGKTNQRNAPAFIFSNIFGLRGIRIICEEISPVAMAGGMESSNVFNTSLLAAASILSGADLSQADIFSLAVKLENDEFGGLTGGQGHICCLLGGAFQHIWLTGEKDAKGMFPNPYSAMSVPLLTDEASIRAIEDHTMLVQAGKTYIDGKAQVGRAASLTNNMWTDLLRNNDSIGLPLHEEKLQATANFTKALKEGDFDTVVREVSAYTERRDKITKRWLVLAIDALKNMIASGQIADPKSGLFVASGSAEFKNVPEYAYNYCKKVWDKDYEKGKYYEEYEMIRDMYKQYGDNLKEMSLYSLDPIDTLVKEALKEGIAIMPLGAGGPGANLMAVSSKGLEPMKAFFESHGINEFNEDKARSIIRGTGELKGYLPFKVGKEPLKIAGFDQLGLKLPEGPANVSTTRGDITKQVPFKVREGQRVYALSDETTTMDVMQKGAVIIGVKTTRPDGSVYTVLKEPTTIAEGGPIIDGGDSVCGPVVNRTLSTDGKNAEFKLDGKTHKFPVNFSGTTTIAGKEHALNLHGMLMDREFAVEPVEKKIRNMGTVKGLQFTLDTKDHPDIQQAFGSLKIVITYFVKDGKTYRFYEVENYGKERTMFAMGGHRWVNVADRTQLIMKVPARKVLRSPADHYPDEAPVSIKDSTIDESLNLEGWTAIGENEYDHAYTDLRADRKGIVTVQAIDPVAGLKFSFTQEKKNLPWVVFWAPRKWQGNDAKHFAVEENRSCPFALNIYEQIPEASPVILNPHKKWSALAGMGVEEWDEKEGLPSGTVTEQVDRNRTTVQATESTL
jgi:galactose mutarotase-like enzyme